MKNKKLEALSAKNGRAIPFNFNNTPLSSSSISDYDVIIDFNPMDGTLLHTIDELLCDKDCVNKLLVAVDKSHAFDTTTTVNRSEYWKELPCHSYTVRDCIFGGNRTHKKVLVIALDVLHKLNSKEFENVRDWCDCSNVDVLCSDMYFDPSLPEDLASLNLIERFTNSQSQIEQLLKFHLDRERNKVNYYKQTPDDDYDGVRIRAPQTCALYETLLKHKCENIDEEKNKEYFNNNILNLYNWLKESKRYENCFYHATTSTYWKKELKKEFGFKLRYYTHMMCVFKTT